MISNLYKRFQNWAGEMRVNYANSILERDPQRALSIYMSVDAPEALLANRLISIGYCQLQLNRLDDAKGTLDRASSLLPADDPDIVYLRHAVQQRMEGGERSSPTGNP